MSSQHYQNSDDKEIITKIKEDNIEAFRLLFDKYFQKLVEFCFYRTKNIDSANDLVQEVFIKLWTSRNHLDPEKSIRAYLYKSLTNQIINLKMHSSSKTLPINESIYKITENESSSLDSKIDIFSAIDLLPQKLRSVFMLSRIEGFKYSEISEILDISVKAVEKRMSKTLKILRKKFEN